MSEPELPDWTNEKMGSMVRAGLWLMTQVGEGNVYTKDQLRRAFPNVAQIDRRTRDLRTHGWVLDTNRDDPALAPHEVRFVRAGEPVWEPGTRRSPRRPEELRLRFAEPLQVRNPPDPEAVWGKLEDLSSTERSLLMAWIAMGHRPSSRVELAWRAFRSLSEGQRRDMTIRLGELISSELSDQLAEADSSTNS
ncbi:hypothetical protein ACIBAG_42320 [Streptomyces sp. NPDC051243]|uniref:hypothetical protein n=1 Tax=Streptomyces sp. NPDC051243 TaxID=3365646 RepID=UPI00378FBF43